MVVLAALRRSWQVPARCWKLSSTTTRAANWQPCRGHRLSPSDDELYQKTTITMLEKESPDMMFINSYSTDGFVINGDKVIGPCVVFPRVILQWNVGSYKDISEESLALFHMLEPRIEILVVGTGDKVQRLDPAVLKFMRQKGVAVEVQDTPNACATFNFLTNERRLAAAGLIPPLYVEKDSVNSPTRKNLRTNETTEPGEQMLPAFSTVSVTTIHSRILYIGSSRDFSS